MLHTPNWGMERAALLARRQALLREWELNQTKIAKASQPTLLYPIKSPTGGILLCFSPDGRSYLWRKDDALFLRGNLNAIHRCTSDVMIAKYLDDSLIFVAAPTNWFLLKADILVEEGDSIGVLDAFLHEGIVHFVTSTAIFRAGSTPIDVSVDRCLVDPSYWVSGNTIHTPLDGVQFEDGLYPLFCRKIGTDWFMVDLDQHQHRLGLLYCNGEKWIRIADVFLPDSQLTDCKVSGCFLVLLLTDRLVLVDLRRFQMVFEQIVERECTKLIVPERTPNIIGLVDASRQTFYKYTD